MISSMFPLPLLQKYFIWLNLKILLHFVHFASHLCNNLYLIDYTIMNEPLCTWLEEEIGMKELAEQLRDLMRMRGSVENFVLTILKASKIYKESEMIRIQNVLEHLKNQKDVER